MIGIIGAMEAEVELLKEALSEQQCKAIGGFKFFSGSLEGNQVVLLRCGLGKVNAAIGSALLITTYKPDFVINTGSAGGIDPALSFGDTVISEGVLYHDVDVTAFSYAPGQLPGMPVIFPIPEALISEAEKAVDELKNEKILPESFNHVRGILGSGDIFMHETETIAKVRATFPNVKAVEMEGAAVAHACFIFNTPVLIIRSLSDIAGSESPVTFSEFLPIASKYSTEIVRRLIRNHITRG